jgi:hypothetical protein
MSEAVNCISNKNHLNFLKPLLGPETSLDLTKSNKTAPLMYTRANGDLKSVF